MAEDKKTKLSIVIRAVDNATAKIKAINARLDAATKPVRDFKKALGELKEKSGLDAVIGGVKGVGSAFRDLLGRLTAIGAVAGVAVFGLKSIIDEFDNLGDTAERVGLSVDALAQLRFAAQKSGIEVEKLDRGMLNFSKMLGQAKAGTGGLKSFLDKVSPALLKQLKAAKGNEEAFNLLAGAMVKLKDPAKRAALAQQAFGDASVATLLARGPAGIAELRKRYLELAGPQGDAVAAAGDFGDSMDDLKASTDGIKAALVSGLAPALKVIVERLREWFTSHRAEIAEWAKNIGEKLPGAVAKVVEWLGKAWDKVKAFIDGIGGIKNAAIAAAAILAGPLIASVVSLGAALFGAGARAVHLVKALREVRAEQAATDTAAGGGGSKGGDRRRMGRRVGRVPFLDTEFASEADLEGIERLANDVVGENKFGKDRWERIKRLRKQGRTELTDTVFRAMDGRTELTDTVFRAMEGIRATRAGEAQQAKIVVDFANAPRGTRVSAAPQSTADVDLSVGYNMLGTP